MLSFIPKIFEPLMGMQRYVGQQGGTGSGKTFGNMQYCFLKVIKYENERIAVAACSFRTLKRGVVKMLRTIIRDAGYEGYFTESKTDLVFYCTTNSTIEFISASNPDMLRGPKWTMLFINECNNVSYEAFMQLNMRTSGKVLLDFNPTNRFWFHTKLLNVVAAASIILCVSTYKDNPFNSPEQVEVIESMKTDANWWQVYGLGELGNSNGRIFVNWAIMDKYTPPPNPAIQNSTSNIQNCNLPGRLLAYGVDFGFTHSPTAIIQLNECDGELWVKELFYKYGSTNEQMIAAAKSFLELGKLTVADCADPKTIEYLQRMGWFGLRPCEKGSDSVLFGLQLLLQRKINVTRDSKNLIAEMNEYEWAKTKDDEYLNTPGKGKHHAIDAMRYAISHPFVKINYKL